MEAELAACGGDVPGDGQPLGRKQVGQGCPGAVQGTGLAVLRGRRSVREADSPTAPRPQAPDGAEQSPLGIGSGPVCLLALICAVRAQMGRQQGFTPPPDRGCQHPLWTPCLLRPEQSWYVRAREGEGEAQARDWLQGGRGGLGAQNLQGTGMVGLWPWARPRPPGLLPGDR